MFKKFVALFVVYFIIVYFFNIVLDNLDAWINISLVSVILLICTLTIDKIFDRENT